MHFIGLMSGTSVDAVDVALVDINGHDISVIHYDQYPISPEIQDRIRSLNSKSTIVDITELDVILGHLFADAVNRTLTAANLQPGDITATGSHGQTVLHLPESRHPRTLQIGDPNIIAAKTGVTTVADFRRADIAVGGQGAPLASAFHAWYFRDDNAGRIILNLGGMANITLLPADINKTISGFDTGPGNALMDNWIQKNLKKHYDHDGEWAASGSCDTELLQILLDEPYFQAVPPKSTGKDEFNLDWLEQKLVLRDGDLQPEDIQATLLELTAETIRSAIQNYTQDLEEILLCGGGAHNVMLVGRLKTLLPDHRIATTETCGIDPDAVEAVTFAWLAKCRLENIPANVPGVTGAKRSLVLGGIYRS